jgi:hypothetical protein
MIDDELPPSPEELAGAGELRRALEGEPAAPGHEQAQAAALIVASVGHEPALGDIAARRIVRGALAEVERKRSGSGRGRALRRWSVGVLGGAAAAALVLFTVALPGTPRRWMSRPSGLLVPGPFPPGQTAAQRLDLVTTDRIEAFRESSLYGVRR